ncbi:fimbrial protein [Providencia rettgeri]|uniref:fimbrial protein n=1 Tax=Providencia rettgeri TaxID=587 RepID=UPI0034E0D349
MFRLILSFVFIAWCNQALAASNSIRVEFEATFYKKTCDIDVSEAVINYNKVSPSDIINSDAGLTDKLNRDITLKLVNCTNVGNLSKSKIYVSGRTETINGKRLFIESGTSQGVGVKLLANNIAKTDGDIIFDLNAGTTVNDTFTVTTALSCGDCKKTEEIKKGTLRAALLFTVLTH